MAKLTKCDRCGMTLYYGDKVDVEAFENDGSVFRWKMCASCAKGFNLPVHKISGDTLVTFKINNEGTYGFYPQYIVKDLVKYVNDYSYDIGEF